MPVTAHAPFTALHVMTSVDELVDATDQAGARAIREQRGFEIVPRVESGAICGFWDAETGEAHQPVELRHVVASDLNLFGLIAVLRERRFTFVLVGDRVAGYIHYSDLNHSVVKVPLYILFEAVERRALRWTRGADIAAIEAALGAPEASRVAKQLHRRRADAADLSPAGQLGFGDLLRLAGHCGWPAVAGLPLPRLVGHRNRVAHAGENLVRRHEQVWALEQTVADLVRLAGGDDPP